MRASPVNRDSGTIEEQLRKTIRHGYRNAPAVREKMDGAGIKPTDIQKIADLQKIPITSKDELIKMQAENPPFGGFEGLPVAKIGNIFVSPGPLYDPQSLNHTAAMAAEAFSVAGAGSGDIILNTFSYHMMPGAHWMDKASRLLGANVIPSGVGNTELQVRIMKDLGVTGYAGTASFLATIIKKAEEIGYNLRRDFKLRFALVGAEILLPGLRKSLEQEYGLIVIDTYGTAELGPFGYTCQQNNGFHIVRNIILEITDPLTGKQLKAGETGQVVVTSLDKAYCLIRFGTGDLSIYSDEPCLCGRKSIRLVRILGRVGDGVKIRGVFVYPHQLRSALATIKEVNRFRLLVDHLQSRDVATLEIEVKGDQVTGEIVRGIEKEFARFSTVRLDKVVQVNAGSIPETARPIDDRRKWE